MARPRRGKARQSCDDWIIEYWTTGDYSAGGFSYFALRRDEFPGLWAEYRAEVMRAWDHPGCRPWGWWRYDAPRLPTGTFPGCYYDGTLPEPRRLISGTGCPLHQKLAHVPRQPFGVWDWFGDRQNPPVFEAQFAYLQRHGLLLPGEVAGPELQPYPEYIEDAANWARIQAILATR